MEMGFVCCVSLCVWCVRVCDVCDVCVCVMCVMYVWVQVSYARRSPWGISKMANKESCMQMINSVKLPWSQEPLII